MQRGPTVASYVKSINQITGDVPLYKPDGKGPMVLRVLPMFVDGVEQPWVDFDRHQEDKDEGFGDQHFQVSAVSVFRDRSSSWFSAVSVDEGDTDFSTQTKSPATLVSEKISQMMRQAGQMRQAGHTNIREDFLEGKFGSWINIQQLHLVQALISQKGGQPLRDRDGNPFRYGIVNLTSSGFYDIGEKLFKARMGGSDGSTAATSVSDSNFGDYVSCAEGNWMILKQVELKNSKGYSATLCQAPAPFENGALNPEYVMGLVRPWTGAPNAIYNVPTHEVVFDALKTVIPSDLLGFCLIGTQFEGLLTQAMISTGQDVQLLVPEAGQSRPRAASPAVARPPAPPPPAAAPAAPSPAAPRAAVPRSPTAPIVRAPTPPPRAGQGPVPPRPPSAVNARGITVQTSAYPGPVRQPVRPTVDDEPMPHLGDDPEEAQGDFIDPADSAPVGI